MIKKKTDGSWEKPSKKEGKVIKLSLEEIIMILKVLNRRLLNWKTYHSYKDKKTPISISWEDDQAKTLWVNIENYSKMLNSSQTELFRMILDHILQEKIEHSTIQQKQEKKEKREETFEQPEIIEEKPQKQAITYSQDQTKKRSQITGSLKGETAKALLILFESGQELWIPKSTIHSDFSSDKNIQQNFLIDNWILKKNKIIGD